MEGTNHKIQSFCQYRDSAYSLVTEVSDIRNTPVGGKRPGPKKKREPQAAQISSSFWVCFFGFFHRANFYETVVVWELIANDLSEKFLFDFFKAVSRRPSLPKLEVIPLFGGFPLRGCFLVVRREHLFCKAVDGGVSALNGP